MDRKLRLGTGRNSGAGPTSGVNREEIYGKAECMSIVPWAIAAPSRCSRGFSFFLACTSNRRAGRLRFKKPRGYSSWSATRTGWENSARCLPCRSGSNTLPARLLGAVARSYAFGFFLVTFWMAALVVLWRTGPDTVSRSVRGITGVSRPRNCLNWSFLGVKVMYILVPRLPHQSGQSGKTTRRFGVNCSIRRKKHPMRLTTRWDLVDRYYGKSLQIPKVVGLR